MGTVTNGKFVAGVVVGVVAYIAWQRYMAGKAKKG